MADGFSGPGRSRELVDVIHKVRNRWRLKLALRGAVIVVAGMFLALMSSAAGLEALRFTAPSILAFRALAVVIFTALIYYGLVRPLRRQVSDSQVALYLEERDKSLQTAILSAVETAAMASEANQNGPSPRLVERLVEQAIERCRAIDDGLAIEREGLRRHVYVLAGVAALPLLLIVFGPAFIRHGLSALVIFQSAEAASPYKIEVLPGSTKIPRGTDQTVKARLMGFTSGDASVMMRSDPAASFERVPLIPGKETGAFEGVLFHLEKTTEYYVESNGVRSPTFSMSVVDLPTVDHLVLEYHFPLTRDFSRAWSIRAATWPRSAARGPLVATDDENFGGRVLLNGRFGASVCRPGRRAPGSFKVDKQGFYRIEFDGPQGEHVSASPQYDRRPDRSDAVGLLAKPGRDTTATPVEEVLASAGRRRLRRQAGAAATR